MAVDIIEEALTVSDSELMDAWDLTKEELVTTVTPIIGTEQHEKLNKLFERLLEGGDAGGCLFSKSTDVSLTAYDGRGNILKNYFEGDKVVDTTYITDSLAAASIILAELDSTPFVLS